MTGRALVTGGSGFLGSHVADALSEAGWEVRVFDTNPSPHLRPDQSLIRGNLLDRDAVEQAVKGCDVVYHLGALADLNEARSKPSETARVNLVATVDLLELCRDAGVDRFLFASTVYVYSRAGGFYRCSKLAAEAYIEEFQRQFGLDYTILRFGSLYGPRADARNGVYRLLRQALFDGAVSHGGTPEDTREYVHVEDAARLSLQALEEEFRNQHLVVTGHHPLRARDLVTMFEEILGRSLEVEWSPDPDGVQVDHYRVTPYAFQPRVGRKLTSNVSIDMGQGLLQMLEELYSEGPRSGTEATSSHREDAE